MEFYLLVLIGVLVILTVLGVTLALRLIGGRGLDIHNILLVVLIYFFLLVVGAFNLWIIVLPFLLGIPAMLAITVIARLIRHTGMDVKNVVLLVITAFMLLLILSALG